ncbi:hypothetical protein JW758_01470 [Candidatus Peregrinibacteria bacterium]|nr:hypothetical protein [Candidatus Peregrinibacteria bacterium]
MVEKEQQKVEVDVKPAEQPTRENGISDLVIAYRNRYPRMHGNDPEEIISKERPFFAWNPLPDDEGDENKEGEDEGVDDLPYPGYVQILD